MANTSHLSKREKEYLYDYEREQDMLECFIEETTEVDFYRSLIKKNVLWIMSAYGDAEDPVRTFLQRAFIKHTPNNTLQITEQGHLHLKNITAKIATLLGK